MNEKNRAVIKAAIDDVLVDLEREILFTLGKGGPASTFMARLGDLFAKARLKINDILEVNK